MLKEHDFMHFNSRISHLSQYVQNHCSEIQQIPVILISINTSELHASSTLVIQNASS